MKMADWANLRKWLPDGLGRRVFLPFLAGLFLLGGLFFLAGCAGQFGPGAGSFHTVVLDAGHGGHDRGARAVSGMNEKELCLDVAKRMKPLLERAGLRVVMTRTTDRFIPLSQRAQASNRIRGSIFVSVHFNWARRQGARGIETFYFAGSPQSRRLAANIQQEMLRAYPTINRGVKQARFYVLRNNNRPAVLLEMGFLSNPQENRLVQDPRVRQRLAEAAVRGIIEERRGRTPRL
jgi:N-acetylmuramoyl-L-alanine amidase